jgi:hypothetical protein
LSCSWIRIRIPNTEPDPGKPYQCGSGYLTKNTTCHVKIFNKGDVLPMDIVLVLQRIVVVNDKLDVVHV